MGNSIKQLAEKCANTLSLWKYEYSNVDSKQYDELEKISRVLNAIIGLKLVDRIEERIIKDIANEEISRIKRQKNMDILVAKGVIPF